jgi:flagellar biosynthesis protein FliQ
MRRAGDVVFSDVNSGTGEGIVEFSNRYVAALAVVVVVVVVVVVIIVAEAVAVTVISSATLRFDLCLIFSHSTLNCWAE